MTRRAILAASGVLFLLLGPGTVHAQEAELDKVLEPYLRIQSQLARDSVEGIANDAAEIERNAHVFGHSAPGIIAPARKLGKAGDLETARAEFGLLSDALVSELDRRRASVPGVETMYCPMVKKSWLQRGTAIQNPYYGPAMLTCGERRKPPVPAR